MPVRTSIQAETEPTLCEGLCHQIRARGIRTRCHAFRNASAHVSRQARTLAGRMRARPGKRSRQHKRSWAALQIKYLIARGTLCLLLSGLPYDEYAADCVAHWAHSRSHVLWPCSDNLLGLSSPHGHRGTHLDYINSKLKRGTDMARGGGFEPPCPCEHGISNPTPYQARRSPHTTA